MALDGKGTKESPYLISTADEFKELMVNHTKETWAELKDDIDFNKSDFWNEHIFIISRLHLDGKGHTLKNLYVKDSKIFHCTITSSDVQWAKSELINIIFEAVIIATTKDSSLLLLSTYSSDWVNQYLDIISCEFRIKSYAISTTSSVRSADIFNVDGSYTPDNKLMRVINCTFNVDWFVDKLNSHLMTINSTRFINNELNINLYITMPSSTSYSIFNGGSTNTSYQNTIQNNTFFIQVDSTATFTDKEIPKLCCRLGTYNQNYSSNSFVIKNVDKGSHLKGFEFRYGHPSDSSSNKYNGIIDKEAAGNISIYNFETNMQLTTAQMKDPIYLASIGFPVV